MPLYDAFGSTIEIVLLGNPQVVANYSYDPYGVRKVNSGYRSPFPFVYHGLEQEYYDSQKLYWEPNGNVYNPDPFQLSLSGPQGLGGGGNGEPRSIVFGTQNAAVNWVGISLGVAQNIAGIFNPNTLTIGSDPPLNIVLPYNPFNLLGGLFQGGIPTIPWYDTTHTSRGAHDIYPVMGIQNIVDQSPSADNSAASDNPGRPLSDCEKCVLAPYIQKVDLDNARVHTNGLPTSGLASFAGLDPGVEAVTPPGGSDIYIRSGHYNPGTPRGLALLAHELLHVEQWREAPGVVTLSYLAHSSRYEDPAYYWQRYVYLKLLTNGQTCK